MTETDKITDYNDLLAVALRLYAQAELLLKAVDKRLPSEEIHALALDCVGLTSAIAKANVAEILKPPDES